MAGDCPSKNTRDILFGKEMDANGYWRVTPGHYLHKMYSDHLSKLFGDAYHSEERELEVELPRTKTKVVGHCDGVLEVDGRSYLLEFKTVSLYSMDKILSSGAPFPAHVSQANMYATALYADWILILYFCKDNGAVKEFVFERDPELFRDTIESLDTQQEAINKGEPIPRTYGDATESPCSFCGHKADCYKDFKAQVQGMREERITDVTFTTNVITHNSSRALRLRMEKAEKEAKSVIAKFMIDAGVNFAHLRGIGTVTLKVGKNNNPLVSVEEIK